MDLTHVVICLTHVYHVFTQTIKYFKTKAVSCKKYFKKEILYSFYKVHLISIKKEFNIKL